MCHRRHGGKALTEWVLTGCQSWHAPDHTYLLTSHVLSSWTGKLRLREFSYPRQPGWPTSRPKSVCISLKHAYEGILPTSWEVVLQALSLACTWHPGGTGATERIELWLGTSVQFCVLSSRLWLPISLSVTNHEVIWSPLVLPVL